MKVPDVRSDSPWSGRRLFGVAALIFCVVPLLGVLVVILVQTFGTLLDLAHLHR